MDGTSWNQSTRHDGASGDECDNDSDFEEVYGSQLAATQVAVEATQSHSQAQLQPTQAAATPLVDAVETVRCMICALNLTSKSIMERELHLNACLDAASLETKYDCPTCGKELTDYNEQRRMAHVNLCLDRLSRLAVQPFSAVATTTESAVDAAQEDMTSTSTNTATSTSTSTNTMDNSDQQLELYDCRICGLQLSLQTIEARSRHVKQCGQRFGLRATDMAASATASISSTSVFAMAAATETETEQESASQHQELQSTQTSDSSTSSLERNAFAMMMASSTSRLTTMGGRLASSATTVVSNAFDVLMKSSRTESVAAQTSSTTTSARAFWHTNASNSNNTSGGTNKSHKRMRFSSSSTSTSTTMRRVGCPDFKRIIGTQPPFIVDGFKYASKALSSVYFLTHFHSDHYIGLQRSFDCGIIYCNQITSALVVQELGIDAKFVHPVPMNTPVDIRGVQVTFMDANHCPGAAIILFKLRSGATYLHTGDFRFHPKMWSYASLRPFVPATLQNGSDADAGADQVAVTRMDGVYLDTTYADPKYTFPTQEASVQHALTLVDKHMTSSGDSSRDRTLYLFGSYSIGKERLFMEVAQRYQRKVCVSKAKLKMIKTYAWPDAKMKLLTTEPAATNLHVVPMQELRLDHLIALQQKHRLRFHQIVAFRPTGWTFSRSNASMATCQSDPSGNVRVYGIPYSEHSSFAELCEFVRVLNPQLIIPTVNCHTERSVKKQVDALRQSAFHGINNLFQPL